MIDSVMVKETTKFEMTVPPGASFWEVKSRLHMKFLEWNKQVDLAAGEEQMLSLYTQLVKARLHDIQLKRWVKQGVITKAWLGSGEEAVTIGMCAALNEGDVVGPMIRNAGALIARGVPLEVR